MVNQTESSTPPPSQEHQEGGDELAGKRGLLAGLTEQLGKLTGGIRGLRARQEQQPATTTDTGQETGGQTLEQQIAFEERNIAQMMQRVDDLRLDIEQRIHIQVINQVSGENFGPLHDLQKALDLLPQRNIYAYEDRIQDALEPAQKQLEFTQGLIEKAQARLVKLQEQERSEPGAAAA